MNINPELERNLWLELSPQRALVMPLVLAGLLWIAWQAGGRPLVGEVARYLYLGLALLLGTRAAGVSVAGEAAAHTWDWQRLTPLPAWRLTLGKLLGAPAFAWYGALPALAVFAASRAAGGTHAARLLVETGLLLLAALLAHAVALAGSLLGVRKRDGLAAGGGSLPFLLGLLAAAAVVQTTPLATAPSPPTVPWFDRDWPLDGFVVASTLVFTALAWTACVRLVRAELGHRNAPWPWLAGAAWLMAWSAGFVHPAGSASPASQADWWGGAVRLLAESAALRWQAAMLVALALGYLLALWESKSPVLLARLLRAARAGRVAVTLALAPRWLYALALALACAVAVLASLPVLGPQARAVFDPATLVVSLLLFAVRDLGLLLVLHTGRDARRADAAWVVYLLLLYLLLPLLLGVLGFGAATAWLRPGATPDLVHGPLLAALLQVLGVAALLARRWRRRGDGAAA